MDWDTTQNLYIEGDNLEVLKLLQKSYAGKIKMIYIDPPYNTGKDFVYKDNYKDNLKNYQEVTGQVDSEGNKLSTNSDSDGRFHSNWLSMMYPRLRLARNLLTDAGVIFMSIDDKEIANMVLLCEKIFGSANQIGVLPVIPNLGGRSDKYHFAICHEYAVVFAKDILKCKFNQIELSEQDRIKKKWKDDEKGWWKDAGTLQKGGGADTREERPNMYYPILVNRETEQIAFITDDEHKKIYDKENKIFNDAYVEELKKVYEHRGFAFILPTSNKNNSGGGIWRKGIKSAKKDIDDLVVKKLKNGVYRIHSKQRPELKDLHSLPSEKPKTLFYKPSYSTSSGTNSLKQILGDDQFPHPKSVELIRDFLEIGCADGIVLDFFSGSSTSAHSLFELNLEDNSKRKFIQVQLPEKTKKSSQAYKSGYSTIAEIGKERIRRVVKKIKEEHPIISKELDLGFKVFKLDSSNIKSWDGNPDNVETSLLDTVENIKPDRTEEDVLYEILLKSGLDLTLPIEERNIEEKKVFNIGLGSLFICLADNMTRKVAEGLGQWNDECNPEFCRVVFKDNGFSDVEKTNSVQTLKRYGIDEIKTI